MPAKKTFQSKKNPTSHLTTQKHSWETSSNEVTDGKQATHFIGNFFLPDLFVADRVVGEGVHGGHVSLHGEHDQNQRRILRAGAADESLQKI